MALAAIIRRAVNAMKESEEKKLIITTGHDDSHVYVRIEDTGTPIREPDRQNMHEEGDPNAQKGFFWALALLKQYGALLQISRESGMTAVSIRMPY
jgi:sensor histidine kinase regulating citrate/malate metabolism